MIYVKALVSLLAHDLLIYGTFLYKAVMVLFKLLFFIVWGFICDYTGLLVTLILFVAFAIIVLVGGYNHETKKHESGSATIHMYRFTDQYGNCFGSRSIYGSNLVNIKCTDEEI